MAFKPLLLSLSLTILLGHLPTAPAHKPTGTQTPGQQQNVTSLEPGKPAIERELAGGQRHSYTIVLNAGQYLYAVVEQRGIDVAVTLTSPDGKPLLEVDSPNGDQGPEPVRWVVETTGVYELSVRAPDKSAKAGHYVVRVVELHIATDDERALDQARKLVKESETLSRANKYAEAIPKAERALAIREKILGAEHLETAESLSSLAEMYANSGGVAKAESLYQRALAIQEKILGREHVEVADTLSNLGLLYINISNYAKPEPLLQRALEIRRKLLGEEQPAVAQSFSNLARFYLGKADYARAEPLYLRALAIWEKTLKPEDPQPAASLNFLGLLYTNKGDYAKAEQYYNRALELRERAFGPDDPQVAFVLNNLALPRLNQGDYDKAEQLLKRALSIYEKALGPERPEVVAALGSLASLYDIKGEYDKAESLYGRVLAIREKTYGPEHPAVAITVSGVAAMYKNKGDYDKAESHYQRALAMEEKFWGSEHASTATSRTNLAVLYAAKGDLDKAVTTQRRAAEISEFNLNNNLATGSERQKLDYLGVFSGQTNWIVSLHAHSAPKDAAARDLALLTILRRKGRALDAMTDSLAALRRRASPQDQALLDQWQNAKTQLARLTLGGVQRATPAEHQAKIKSLVEQVEKFEETIGSHLPEFGAQSQPVTIAAVQAAIPDQSALIEFLIYRPFDPKAKRDRQLGAARYVAYVLGREGEAKWVELGEAEAIDKAVSNLRQALRHRERQDVKPLARAVGRMVMQPLYPLLGNAGRIFISPDSSLNLIPFAALVDSNDRYLIERFSFTFLSSGRDLLRLRARPESRNEPLIVANPAFGEVASTEQSSRGLGLPPAGKQNAGPQTDLSRLYFQQLPGTASEAQALKKVLPQAKVLTQDQATKKALMQSSGPRLLHIATHGFFLEDVGTAPENTRGLGLSLASAATVPSVRIENPLLRSGLVLAGANEHRPDDDGILTALEVAGLDLWGTKLVVLSACNTGVGEVKNGEGVYGLRRALVLAGAETQLMSLWPVSDQGTRDLMVAYYQALQRGVGRGEALRQVQLRMLRSGTHRHPYYWASFIQSGEWKGL